MQSFDVKKTNKAHYSASKNKVAVIEIDKMSYIMIDGVGNPTVDDFRLKSKVLKLLAKEIKEILKDKGIQYTVPPLEGLWDTYDNTRFNVSRKDMIRFTLMMSIPSEVNIDYISDCQAKLLSKSDNPYIMDVYMKSLHEGKCVQMLHKGAYNTEINTTKEIMEFITVENLKLVGFHHEIYLNDPDKVEAEDLKTIVRYAVKGA